MSIISTVPKGAAVEGINPNLLRNWYFVGGGTGRGVFPVNSRGASSYSSTSGINCIDGWRMFRGTITVNSSDIYLVRDYSAGGAYAPFHQKVDGYNNLIGKKVTASLLQDDNTLYYDTFIVPATGSSYMSNTYGETFKFYMNPPTSASFEIGLVSTDATLHVKAVKLELGDQQTLAHQENSAWVLNEIPTYEEEYYRCITSDADSGDTYANQKVSNITVQCNSVGSSSLRYYNKLIQSTHKVLDSTFSNPAAQTSDITVTTYDGYLDFSNGFASGATTNITLVLGTSGPVLSTSTTAPS